MDYIRDRLSKVRLEKLEPQPVVLLLLLNCKVPTSTRYGEAD